MAPLFKGKEGTGVICENILFVLFLLKKDVICTEIIIFAKEIRKHMINIAGRNSKEKTTPFFLLYGQDVRM